MSFIDVTLIKQLNDIAQEVSRRICKNALGQMFAIETVLIKNYWQSGLIKKSNRSIQNFWEKINMKEYEMCHLQNAVEN